MTQSLPSENTEFKSDNSTDISQKDFRDLSTAEMEQLMKRGIEKAKKRMHELGVKSVVSIDGKIYEESPDGTRSPRHK